MYIGIDLHKKYSVVTTIVTTTVTTMDIKGNIINQKRVQQKRVQHDSNSLDEFIGSLNEDDNIAMEVFGYYQLVLLL